MQQLTPSTHQQYIESLFTILENYISALQLLTELDVKRLSDQTVDSFLQSTSRVTLDQWVEYYVKNLQEELNNASSNRSIGEQLHSESSLKLSENPQVRPREQNKKKSNVPHSKNVDAILNQHGELLIKAFTLQESFLQQNSINNNNNSNFHANPDQMIQHWCVYSKDAGIKRLKAYAHNKLKKEPMMGQSPVLNEFTFYALVTLMPILESLRKMAYLNIYISIQLKSHINSLLVLDNDPNFQVKMLELLSNLKTDALREHLHVLAINGQEDFFQMPSTSKWDIFTFSQFIEKNNRQFNKQFSAFLKEIKEIRSLFFDNVLPRTEINGTGVASSEHVHKILNTLKRICKEYNDIFNRVNKALTPPRIQNTTATTSTLPEKTKSAPASNPIDTIEQWAVQLEVISSSMMLIQEKYMPEFFGVERNKYISNSLLHQYQSLQDDQTKLSWLEDMFEDFDENLPSTPQEILDKKIAPKAKTKGFDKNTTYHDYLLQTDIDFFNELNASEWISYEAKSERHALEELTQSIIKKIEIKNNLQQKNILALEEYIYYALNELTAVNYEMNHLHKLVYESYQMLQNLTNTICQTGVTTDVSSNDKRVKLKESVSKVGENWKKLTKMLPGLTANILEDISRRQGEAAEYLQQHLNVPKPFNFINNALAKILYRQHQIAINTENESSLFTFKHFVSAMMQLMEICNKSARIEEDFYDTLENGIIPLSAEISKEQRKNKKAAAASLSSLPTSSSANNNSTVAMQPWIRRWRRSSSPNPVQLVDAHKNENIETAQPKITRQRSKTLTGASKAEFFYIENKSQTLNPTIQQGHASSSKDKSDDFTSTIPTGPGGTINNE